VVQRDRHPARAAPAVAAGVVALDGRSGGAALQEAAEHVYALAGAGRRDLGAREQRRPQALPCAAPATAAPGDRDRDGQAGERGKRYGRGKGPAASHRGSWPGHSSTGTRG
jgi:hypothetical protein